MYRVIIALLFALSAILAMADRKMTVRNSDTGESFEVTVPDGLRIYEYNGNWLDSIPYLMEHARYGEPWAYEALADCYRYGKGGVQRSFFTSLCFDQVAGKDMNVVIAEIREKDNDDPYVIFTRMIDYIERKDYKRIECAIDILHGSGYHDADILLQFTNGNGAGISKHEVIEYIIDKNTGGDACVFAAGGFMMSEHNDTAKIEMDWALPLLLEKIPYLYSVIGEKAYKNTIKSDDSDGYAEDSTEKDIGDRRKAVEYLMKADEHAMLTKEGARLLCHYCTQDPTSDWVQMADEDLYRISIIAGEL